MKYAFVAIIALILSNYLVAKEIVSSEITLSSDVINLDIDVPMGNVIKLSSDVMDNLSLEVPEGKFWHITWKNPNCEGFCSYDIGVEGWLKIGDEKRYIVRNARIRLDEHPTGEIWVDSYAIVTIQIPPKLVKIIEYSNK